jgi:predicted unusual protein kinase regulating ubiquinone biosynthesis (AarF/ABC1/UbiB family)
VARETDVPRTRVVPTGRFARLGALGRIASGVAVNMLANGVRQLATGQRPAMSDLLLTPRNVAHVTEQLSRMRGAAMKLGQMVSLDAGDFLSPELSQILSVLRNDAHHMPHAQLQTVLEREWGKGWRSKFNSFDARPIAAASIGQVHRAVAKDGRPLAIKIQYPGVRQSIDSDVDNVAALLRLSGLLTGTLDVSLLLSEAKQQLHDETDYVREARHMRDYAALLLGDARFLVPRSADDLSTETILAMDYIASSPIEALERAPVAQRDAAVQALIELVLNELFAFGLMQTDPNFANYRWQQTSGKIVLLDFGAVRVIGASLQNKYRALLAAGLDGNAEALERAAIDVGFLTGDMLRRHGPTLRAMIATILHETERVDLFDFGDRSFLDSVREQGAMIARDRQAWHTPPAEMLFLQRKISGTALLAARMKARLPLRALVASSLDAPLNAPLARQQTQAVLPRQPDPAFNAERVTQNWASGSPRPPVTTDHPVDDNR